MTKQKGKLTPDDFITSDDMKKKRKLKKPTIWYLIKDLFIPCLAVLTIINIIPIAKFLFSLFIKFLVLDFGFVILVILVICIAGYVLNLLFF